MCTLLLLFFWKTLLLWPKGPTVNEWALPRVCRRDPGQRHPLWSPLKPPTSFQAYSCVLSSQQAPQQVLCLPSAIAKASHDNWKSPILVGPSSLHFISANIFCPTKKLTYPFFRSRAMHLTTFASPSSNPHLERVMCLQLHDPLKLLADTNPVFILELKLLIYCSLNLSLYIPFSFYIGLLMVDIILPNTPLSQHIPIPRHAYCINLHAGLFGGVL